MPTGCQAGENSLSVEFLFQVSIFQFLGRVGGPELPNRTFTGRRFSDCIADGGAPRLIVDGDCFDGLLQSTKTNAQTNEYRSAICGSKHCSALDALFSGRGRKPERFVVVSN